MTKVNDHDRKIVEAAAEVVHWGTQEEDHLTNTPQVVMLGHNPDAMDILSSKVASDLIEIVVKSEAGDDSETAGFIEALGGMSEDELNKVHTLISVAFQIGVFSAEVAYIDHIPEVKGE